LENVVCDVASQIQHNFAACSVAYICHSFCFHQLSSQRFWAGQEEGQRNLFNLALAAQVSLADDDTSTITVNRKQSSVKKMDFGDRELRTPPGQIG